MNLLGGPGSLGMDLMQLIIAPTAAFKVAPNHSIGIAPLLGYQKFAATGLQRFAASFRIPGNVLKMAMMMPSGFGVRIGYMGKITPTVTIGAAYASKMDFQEFDKYKGLFARTGRLRYSRELQPRRGLAGNACVKLALDYQHINYAMCPRWATLIQLAGRYG